jgi:hypothetical protein
MDPASLNKSVEYAGPIKRFSISGAGFRVKRDVMADERERGRGVRDNLASSEVRRYTTARVEP